MATCCPTSISVAELVNEWCNVRYANGHSHESHHSDPSPDTIYASERYSLQIFIFFSHYPRFSLQFYLVISWFPRRIGEKSRGRHAYRLCFCIGPSFPALIDWARTCLESLDFSAIINWRHAQTRASLSILYIKTWQWQCECSLHRYNDKYYRLVESL